MSNDGTRPADLEAHDSLPRKFDVYIGAAGTSSPGNATDSPRYSLEKTIGEGGMGVIVKVFDHSLQRTLAMKLLKDERGSGGDRTSKRSRTLRSRFLKEAQVTGQLDHPGIVPVHELGTCDGGRAYFTMPLVRGKSLSDVLALTRDGKEGWSLPRVVGVLIRVCQAVAFAHSKGVVHRDLKPANVMVGRFGEVYVLDWGLAKVRDEGRHTRARAESADAAGISEPESTVDVPATEQIAPSSSIETLDGTVMGTPAYMSPEQASGRIDEIDEASDVYSLGAMLYELLTGEPPYTPRSANVSPRMVLARLLEEPPRPIAAIRPGAPPGLVAICEKAMSRDKSSRYRDSFELAEDLQAHLDNRVVGAYRTGSIAELKAWMTRHRTLLKSVAAVALVLGIIFLVVVWVTRHQEAKRLLGAAEARLADYEELKTEAPLLEEAWKAAIPRQRWWPEWKRQEELNAYRRVEEARRELAVWFNDAVRDFEDAINIAPPFSLSDVARRKLGQVYYQRRLDILGGGGTTEQVEFYARKLRDLGMFAEVTETLRVRSIPAGADVYCFRYEEREAHLVPLPFDVERGEIAGETFLRVEKIWDAEKHQGVFQPGDRLLSVRGQPVRLRGDLARSLEGVAVDASVSVLVERLGSRTELDWIPFPGYLYREGSPPADADLFPYKPSSLLNTLSQLGLRFEGYPLEFTAECRVGKTAAERTLELTLPRGRYLLVLRRIGYDDVRFPVLVPSHREREVASIRLLKPGEVPDGFVYIPAGPVAYGGDSVAFQSLEGGEEHLDGFLIGRHEVTLGEYLEFLNDADVVTSELGFYEPKTKAVRSILSMTEETQLLLVLAKPWRKNLSSHRDDVKKDDLLLTKIGGKWAIPNTSKLLKETTPVFLVPQLAALEYVHWRTQKEGGRRRYRLPTDKQWEKAARGVDRRIYVWGDYLVRTFCWSARGGYRKTGVPFDTELFPLDESVYGVRDLAGSVEEYTSDNALPGSPSRRGGSWYNIDDTHFRAATRSGRVAYARGADAGFRMVLELPPERTTPHSN